MRRLAVPPGDLRVGELTVGGEAHRYLTRALRLAPGAEVTLFDGLGHQALATIVGIDAEKVTFRVGELIEGTAADRPQLTLILALLKGEKMDLVVQKATELGVAAIVPAATDRSVVRLEAERATGRAARWRKIAAEAARQCGRADVPRVDEPITLSAALAGAPESGPRILLHGGGSTGRPLRELLEPAAQVTLAVGPEGGFSETEVATAQAQGFAIAGVGPLVLRAETAAIAACAIVAHVLGDLG
jgi:16S rRNA (uracil1498-N3)-methyltransferase